MLFSGLPGRWSGRAAGAESTPDWLLSGCSQPPDLPWSRRRHCGLASVPWRGTSADEPAVVLTKRQRRAALLMAKGLTNREIAVGDPGRDRCLLRPARLHAQRQAQARRSDGRPPQSRAGTRPADADGRLNAVEERSEAASIYSAVKTSCSHRGRAASRPR